jgi:hypothetical protein
MLRRLLVETVGNPPNAQNKAKNVEKVWHCGMGYIWVIKKWQRAEVWLVHMIST